MKSKQNFDIKIIQLQCVQPDDEASQITKEVAIDFADFKYRTFPSQEKANKAISMNAFFESSENSLYVQSKNQILGKKFIGEKVVGMFITESKFTSQIINVKIAITVIRQPSTNSGRAEIVLTSEIDLPSLKPMETVIVPFQFWLESFTYESANKSQRKGQFLRNQE